MEWKYVKPLSSATAISEFEKEFNRSLPDEFKKFVKLHNGGRPERRAFTMEDGTEREIKTFLSFNRTDRENVWKLNDPKAVGFTAFAIDNFGNLIGFTEKNTVTFWKHESDTAQTVAGSFDDFLGLLQSTTR